MKKWFSKTTVLTTAGLVAIGGIGASGYFIARAIGGENDGKHVFHYTTAIKENMGIGPELINNPIDDGKNKDKFFLSKEDLKLLKLKLINDLQYGPEVVDLGQIRIDDKNIVDSENNLGAYVANYDIINITTDSWREDGLLAVPIDQKEDPQAFEKINLIFQVIFHEYGHFIANEYINSEPKTDLINKIYSFQATNSEKDKNNTISNNWNKKVYSTFKNLLGYDRLYTGKVKASRVGTKRNPNGLFETFSKKGRLYDTYKGVTRYKIFNESNSEDKSKLVGDDKNVTNDTRYYFSMDELWTRKFQEILMPLPIKDAEEWDPPKTKSQWTPYGYDIYMNGLKDNPFRKASEMYELFKNVIGMNTQNSISHISVFGDKLVVGGYSKTPNAKLLINGKLLSEVKISSAETNVELNGASKMLNYIEDKNQSTYLNPGGDKTYFWVSNEIPVKDIVGKSLSLLINGREVALHTKDSIWGTISTYRSLINHSNNYHVTNNKGIVKIESGSGA